MPIEYSTAVTLVDTTTHRKEWPPPDDGAEGPFTADTTLLTADTTQITADAE